MYYVNLQILYRTVEILCSHQWFLWEVRFPTANAMRRKQKKKKNKPKTKLTITLVLLLSMLLLFLARLFRLLFWVFFVSWDICYLFIVWVGECVCANLQIYFDTSPFSHFRFDYICALCSFLSKNNIISQHPIWFAPHKEGRLHIGKLIMVRNGQPASQAAKTKTPNKKISNANFCFCEGRYYFVAPNKQMWHFMRDHSGALPSQ